MTLPSDTSKPDPRIQSILNELEKTDLEKRANETFVDADVHLDGREFTDCTFKNCRMFASLGHFRLVGKGTQLDRCQFMASPPAARVKAVFDVFDRQKKK